MASNSETTDIKNEDKLVGDLVQSVLDGNTSIEELRAQVIQCDECDKILTLEEIIKDCLKNRMEKKCCPEKIVNELKLKLGIPDAI